MCRQFDTKWPGLRNLLLKVAEALTGRNGVLLANHGAAVCGKDMQVAFYKAKLLEKTATIYSIAKALNEPKRLPDASIKTTKRPS